MTKIKLIEQKITENVDLVSTIKSAQQSAPLSADEAKAWLRSIR
jgi:hypothetical protein